MTPSRRPETMRANQRRAVVETYGYHIRPPEHVAIWLEQTAMALECSPEELIGDCVVLAMARDLREGWVS